MPGSTSTAASTAASAAAGSSTGQPPATTRRFLIVGHDATTDPKFSLSDLPGAGGRIDVLARCVTSALCLSHGLRTDTEAWLALEGPGPDGPRTLRIDGAAVRHLNPDERSTAALIRKALTADVVPNGVFEDASPGITVAEMGFAEALVRFSAEAHVVVLDKDGVDLRSAPDGLLIGPRAGPENDDDGGLAAGFVLSDHRPFGETEWRDIVALARDARISVGDQWLHGHVAIALVHDELDRRTRAA